MRAEHAGSAESPVDSTCRVTGGPAYTGSPLPTCHAAQADAGHRAFEMKIPGGKLSKQHRQVTRFLRRTFYKTGKVPTAAETCEANDLEIRELEALFPDGCHRGAVKIPGLRVR